MRDDLRIEDEDSLNAPISNRRTNEPFIAWIRYPQVSNTQDQLPWQTDTGIESRWIEDPSHLDQAAAIVLPGSKSPLSDLHWLRKRGLDQKINNLGKSGVPVVGICGGFQMLGESLHDSETNEIELGLNLLPVKTEYKREKTVTRRLSKWKACEWETFEIHCGITSHNSSQQLSPLLEIYNADGSLSPDGFCHKNIWGSYQHGLFEAPSMRQRLVDAAKLNGVRINPTNYRETRQATYQAMGEFLANHLDLTPIRRYLDL